MEPGDRAKSRIETAAMAALPGAIASAGFADAVFFAVGSAVAAFAAWAFSGLLTKVFRTSGKVRFAQFLMFAPVFSIALGLTADSFCGACPEFSPVLALAVAASSVLAGLVFAEDGSGTEEKCDEMPQVR